jgi:hypothetical protein
VHSGNPLGGQSGVCRFYTRWGVCDRMFDPSTPRVASWTRHLGGGIWEEAFWVKACGRRHLGGGIWGGSILEKAFVGGICEEASGRRHLGGGMGEGASGWRHLGGCTREKASMRMHPEKTSGGNHL